MEDKTLMAIESAILKGDIESDDHQEKNNRSFSEIEAADEKMVKHTVDKKVQNDDNKYMFKNGKKMFKRTKEDYDNIWNAFLEIAEPEFKEFMGYGKEEIEKIGIEKFIDAYDWRDSSSVTSYKTDALHIIPCVHCGNEFVTFEQDLGLCDKCAELYDIQMFKRLIDEVVTDKSVRDLHSGQILTANCISSFVYDAELRNKFLKSELDKRDIQDENILKTKWERRDSDEIKRHLN